MMTGSIVLGVAVVIVLYVVIRRRVIQPNRPRSIASTRGPMILDATYR
jgi:hypothetical protein